AFFGAYSTAIFPASFNFSVSISILIMIILGGMGSLRGVVLGAFAIRYLSDTLLPFLGKYIDDPLQGFGASLPEIPVIQPLLAGFTLSSYNYLLYGVLLAVMMIFRPEGLLPAAARKAELHGEGVAAESTFGTSDEVAEAASEYQASIHELPSRDGEPPSNEEHSGDRGGGA
ncbi:MAG TPA: hypothetical protein VLS28_01140, partial [Candidatus Sulfomarinibacteraceae bacterium]|nr:hypothetical protein [Candidatus Sulfomarinibacteraceae bacterium]